MGLNGAGAAAREGSGLPPGAASLGLRGVVADRQREADQGDVLDGSPLPGDDVAESRPGNAPFPEESRAG
jgi:hypothetical protein